MRSKVITGKGPHFWEETVEGFKVQVITGYDIGTNRYPVHVRIVKDGKLLRERNAVALGISETDALGIGFQHGRMLIADRDFIPHGV